MVALEVEEENVNCSGTSDLGTIDRTKWLFCEAAVCLTAAC
jgi:hypothetical protein